MRRTTRLGDPRHELVLDVFSTFSVVETTVIVSEFLAGVDGHPSGQLGGKQVGFVEEQNQ
jgi:hypothetical protein